MKEIQIIAVLSNALKKIKSGEIYEKFSSEDASYSDLGRYVWPERVKYLQKLAQNALDEANKLSGSIEYNELNLPV